MLALITVLLMVVASLGYALIKALNIPQESTENIQNNSMMLEYPHLFPWPIK